MLCLLKIVARTLTETRSMASKQEETLIWTRLIWEGGAERGEEQTDASYIVFFYTPILIVLEVEDGHAIM